MNHNFRLVLCLCAILALPGCGKDPMAGKGGPSGDHRTETPGLDSNEKDFDPGLVAAYKVLQTSREQRNLDAYRAAFAGSPGDDGMELFTETATAQLARIQFQFQVQDISGDRATLRVKEKIEERDPKNPKGDVHVLNLDLEMSLVKSAGSWKIASIKVDWK